MKFGLYYYTKYCRKCSHFLETPSGNLCCCIAVNVYMGYTSKVGRILITPMTTLHEDFKPPEACPFLLEIVVDAQ